MLETPTSWYEVRSVICPFLHNNGRNIMTRKLNCKNVIYTYDISESQVWDTMFLIVGMVATYYLQKTVRLHDD